MPELKRRNIEKAEAWGLIPLVGTDKQSSWENDIRVGFMEALLEEKIAPEPALAAILNQYDTAKFWIDKKYDIYTSMSFCILLRKVKELEVPRDSISWGLATAMGFGLPAQPKKRVKAE